MSVEECQLNAMKLVAFLTVVLDITSVYSLVKVPFKVRKVSKETIWTGPAPRIYNGIEANEGQFPYMIFALMKVPSGILQCSASLLSPDWVLLAAHCVSFQDLTSENIILVGGKANLLSYVRTRLRMDFHAPIDEAEFGLQERRAKAFFSHPAYDDQNLHHDVALIQLNEAFNSSVIETIPLSEDKIKERKRCRILGWGLTNGNYQTYKLNFVENKEVSTTKMGCLYKYSGPFICLRPDKRGICQGDSGSPLVCEGKVWGVASHLVALSPDPDCGDSAEEYYSELYADLKWIKSVYNRGNSVAVINLKGLLACLLAVLWLLVEI